jgi:hypothetical protein
MGLALPATPAGALARAPAAARLSGELDRLGAMNAASLRRRWRMVFGRGAPELLRTLLQRALAYRIQADAMGDLDRDTIRMLDRLAREGRDGTVIPLPELRSTKPGTLLVREWEGTLQRVMVLKQGFAWNGQTYDSLSRTKRALILDLLAREDGASLEELIAATGWLPHTTRAALSRLRTSRQALVKSARPDGRTAYRIVPDEPEVEAKPVKRTRAARRSPDRVEAAA